MDDEQCSKYHYGESYGMLVMSEIGQSKCQESCANFGPTFAVQALLSRGSAAATRPGSIR